MNGATFKDITIQGTKADGTREKIGNLERIEGNHPMEDIVSLNGKATDIKTEQAIAIYRIKGRGNTLGTDQECFSVRKGQHGVVETNYLRRLSEDLYISSDVAQANTRETKSANTEILETMSRKHSSPEEVQKIIHTFYKVEEIKKQNLPEEIDPTKNGIELSQLTEDEAKKEIKINLLKDDRYKFKYNVQEVDTIVDYVYEDGYDFEVATAEVDKQKPDTEKEFQDETHELSHEDEEEQRTPGGDALSRRGF